MSKRPACCLVADMKTAEQKARALKAQNILRPAHTGGVRLIDVSVIHTGFHLLDNEDTREVACFVLCDPAIQEVKERNDEGQLVIVDRREVPHPNLAKILAPIEMLNPSEIDAIPDTPKLGLRTQKNGAAEASPAYTDKEMEPLATRYQLIAGKMPDKRWKKDRLLREIEQLESTSSDIDLGDGASP